MYNYKAGGVVDGTPQKVASHRMFSSVKHKNERIIFQY